MTNDETKYAEWDRLPIKDQAQRLLDALAAGTLSQETAQRYLMVCWISQTYEDTLALAPISDRVALWKLADFPRPEGERGRPVQVYRVAARAARRGMSWVYDLAAAQDRAREDNAPIWTADAPTSAILAEIEYYGTVQEVIVDPVLLGRIELVDDAEARPRRVAQKKEAELDVYIARNTAAEREGRPRRSRRQEEEAEFDAWMQRRTERRRSESRPAHRPAKYDGPRRGGWRP